MQTEILKARFFTPGYKGRMGLPVIQWGPPGIGKSSMPEQVAAACGLRFLALISSLKDPSEFGGIPVPMGDRMRYLPPAWAIEANEGGPIVIQFDEITTCAPATQAALLRVILEGMVGEYKLGDHVRFIAAANPVSMAAGGYDIAPPLANRFGHETVPVPEVESWQSYMMGLNGGGPLHVDPAEAKRIEDHVMREWPGAFSNARGAMVAFIRANRSMLFKMPAPDTPEASGAWASPRSVEMGTRALAGAAIHKLTIDQRQQFVGSHVGTGFAIALEGFMAQLDLPDAVDVLDGKVVFNIDKKRLDRTAAVLTSCTAFAAHDKSKENKSRMEVLWSLLDEVVTSHADLVIPAFAELKKAGKIDQTNKTSTKIIARAHGVAKAAGMVA